MNPAHDRAATGATPQVSGQVNQGKMAHPGPARPAVPIQQDMTTVPKEINAAAAKSSAADKHTPMMQQYLSVT